MTELDVIDIALRIDSCSEEVFEILQNYEDLMNSGHIHRDKYESVLYAYCCLKAAFTTISFLTIEVEKC